MGVDIIDAIFACCFFPNPSVEIGAINIVVKEKQSSRLLAHFIRSARCKLPHAISNNILDRDNGSDAVHVKVNQDNPITIRQSV